MADVLAFPLSSRRDLVRNQVRRMRELSGAASEAHLSRCLQQQRETFTRKGIAANEIAAQLRSLELTIRAELHRHLEVRNGGA